MSQRTLLLRFAGPAQSWASAPYAVKATEGVPTRSAVNGLIGAALGAPRGGIPGWLTDATVLARVDRPGTVVVDFHTITPPPTDLAETRTRSRFIASLGTDTQKADYTVRRGNELPSDGNAHITQRAYLADAEFLIAITHPVDGRVDEISEALSEPVFMPYLGRKAFCPAFPFHLGVHNRAAHDLLATVPTSAPAGLRLAVHAIEQDRNYAADYVTPDRAATRIELWEGWKAA